jgi:1,4-dihydroxy-2-naphthoate octaprenyltransferase/chlorophyll synthase
LYVGVGTGATALVVAIVAQILMDRQGLALATIGCLAIFFAYTFAPLKLNYRGGGELLEMLGLGFALPLWHAYLQSGISVPAGIIYLPAFALMCLASALASGLADEQSDRAGGKCTFVTTFGAEAVRQASEGLVLGAMIVFALLPFMVPGRASAWVVAPMLIVMAVEYAGLRRAGMRGDVATPKGTKRFKAHLHGCIWRGGAMLALGLIARALVFRVCAHEIGWLG